MRGGSLRRGKGPGRPSRWRSATRRASRPRPGSPRRHTGGLQEPGSTKLPDDLYARWVQFGTFQPIDRLHSNHSDRLPWQYGPDYLAASDSIATTSVWFPPGDSWTDIFTGKTYRGGTTQNITTTLDTMPVFKRH